MVTVLIDCNEDRLEVIQKLLYDSLPNIKINSFSTLSEKEIDNIDCDLMVVHKNNPEAMFIEDISDCPYPRVIFSGGYTSDSYYNDESTYYVRYNNLVRFIIDLVEDTF